MIEGVVGFVLGGVAEMLAWLGFDRLAERVERKNRPDPRNFPPPR